jgi:two-component sensor histidine kinase
MKRLLYFFVVVFSCKLPAQSFPVKNANDEYIVTSLKGSEKFRDESKEVIRDKNGLYWFQTLANISSFDGANWKRYSFTDAKGRNVPVRINEIEVTDDSTIWLATPEGMYIFNPRSEKFVPIKQIFPKIKGMPVVTNCIYKGIDNFLVVSIIKDGFYIFNWHTGDVKDVTIDSINKVNVSLSGIELFVTTDHEGNYWGLTKENKGIWSYKPSTGEIKCSWKGEIFPSLTKRLQGKNITGITYSKKDNSLLLLHSGILEKIFLSTGRSVFYAFSGELDVTADSTARDRISIRRVKIDPEGNEWLLLEDHYLVKLNSDITKCEYLKHDPDQLSLGKMDWLLPTTNMTAGEGDTENKLLWIIGEKGLSILKKRNAQVKQVPFEKISIDGIKPDDYISGNPATDPYPVKNILYVSHSGGNYLIFQKNPGRPKLLKFDKDLHITNALFNDKWKQYPAYYNPVLNSDTFYIAILRPGDEPLDFRNVVIKDFKVDLKTMKAEEADINFSERVWRYGAADVANVHWLFSNGYLYSYDAQKDRLDSIFICTPYAKKPYKNSRIKGFDFPTVLHKNSSTFWISFISNKELYKIDLRKRKIVKVFKSCLDQKDCLLGSVYQLYSFDSSWIYLKFNMAAGLLNPANDSFTFYSDLFKNKLPYEDYVTSFVYKDWLCSVTTSEINLQNTVTGKQKRLSLNEDFKWPISSIFSPKPVNDRGEIVLISSPHKGYIVFNLDSIAFPPSPGAVRFSLIRLDEKILLPDSVMRLGNLQLKYNSYSSLHFKFSDYSLIEQDKIKYEYTLYNGGDTVWNKIESEPDVIFTRISPGSYKLMIRASNGFGDYSKITALNISILPLFTQTPWFIVLVVLIVGVVLYGIYRYRLQQVRRLQTIRNNIASDLHDDIGSTLNSISIYSEVAKQQAQKEIPALDLIGLNSRKIIESMSDIVWTINPENDSFEKIIVRMRSFAHQLLKAKRIEYTFEADEKLNSINLPMQVRKNFYLVFKETITNLVKYSAASRVTILLKEENKTIFLRIRDNGSGIPVNSETQGNGLMNMKRRAEEINARLNIVSMNGEGTEVGMTLKT